MTGHPEATFAIPRVPPSLNTHVRAHWRVYATAKRLWQKEMERGLEEAGVPPSGMLHAQAVLTFPIHRKRDTGNYRYMLEKALGDACVSLGVLPDDTPEHYSFGDVNFQWERGARRTEVLVRWEG